MKFDVPPAAAWDALNDAQLAAIVRMMVDGHGAVVRKRLVQLVESGHQDFATYSEQRWADRITDAALARDDAFSAYLKSRFERLTK